mmetsp:Transcript_29529/g.38811  ORF Transcript_29529/g.38811 Transcript_29529/m.38811 type:complete len:1302 (-) Transcript_29529:420-4325(-)
MGKASSKPKKEPLLDDIEQSLKRRDDVPPFMREYITPKIREKRRLDIKIPRPGINELDAELVDHSVDRYDYLLVIQNPDNFKPKSAEGKEDGVEEEKGEEAEAATMPWGANENGKEEEEEKLDEDDLDDREQKRRKEKRRKKIIAEYGKHFLKWEDAEMLWRQATPGLEEDKQMAVRLLGAHWKTRSDAIWDRKTQDTSPVEEESEEEKIYMKPGTKVTAAQLRRKKEEELAKCMAEEVQIEKDDELPLPEWLDLLWDILTNTLSVGFGVSKKCAGLHLKLGKTPDKKFLVCRIRAPFDLLEQIAQENDYRLPLRDEVDPGQEFWNEDEVLYEKQPLQAGINKKKAFQRLQQLYNIYRIPPNQVNINDLDEPSERHWARRIRILERIVDRIPCTNRYPAYAPFRSAPAKRILYKPNLTIRGHSLFQSKDRLTLVNLRVQNFFFMDVLIEKHKHLFGEDFEELFNYYPLHDASRGDVVTKESLRKSWVYFWRVDAKRVGAPLVTMHYMDYGVKIPFGYRLFSQPLEDIRGYFGEKLGLYFAWLGAFCWNLRLWFLFGIAIQVYLSNYGTGCASDEIQYWPGAVLIMVVLQTSFMHINWVQEEQAIAVKWGTEGFEETESDRPEFVPDDEEPLIINPINDQVEVNYPDEKRTFNQILHYSLIMVFIGILCIAVDFVYWLENFLVYDVGLSWGSDVGSVVSVIQIEILSRVYTVVVEWMNERENHRTETSYEDSLITKTLLFQMVNKYAALTYTAFIKKHTYGCDGSCCLSDLSTLLVYVFIGSMVSNCFEIGIHEPIIEAVKGLFSKEEEGDGEDDEDNDADADPFLMEMKLDDDEGTFEDYAEIVLLYGYITLFAMALPSAAGIALLMVLVEIRVDAYKYTGNMKRPTPTPAEDVGMWGNLTLAMGTLAIPFNVGIAVFTTDNFSAYSQTQQLLFFLTINHVALLVKYAIHALSSDEPDWLDTIKKRQEFVKQKYFQIADYEEDEDGAILEKHVIDVNDLDFDKEFLKAEQDLKDPGQAWKIPKITKLVNEKKAELREKLGRMKKVEEHLGKIAKKEYFRRGRDVAVDRQGVPLGLIQLSVKKLKVEAPVDQFGTQELYVELPKYSDLLITAALTYAPGTKYPVPPSQNADHIFPSSEENTFDVIKEFLFTPVATRKGILQLELKKKTGEQMLVKRTKKLVDVYATIGKLNLYLSEEARSAGLQGGPGAVVLSQKGQKFGFVEMQDCKEGSYSLMIEGSFNYSKKEPLEEEKRKLKEELKEIEQSLAELYLNLAEIKQEEEEDDDKKEEEENQKRAALSHRR